MGAILCLSLVLIPSACGQKYPAFFDNEDLKEMGFMDHRFNPNPIVKQKADPKPEIFRYHPSNEGGGPSPAPSEPDVPPPPKHPRVLPGYRGNSEFKLTNNAGYDYDLIKKIAQKYLPDASEEKDVNEQLDDMYEFEAKVSATDKWDELMKMIAEDKKQDKNFKENFKHNFKKYNDWIDDIIEEQKTKKLFQHGDPQSEIRSPSPGFAEYWPTPKPQPKSLRNGPFPDIPPVPAPTLLRMAKDRANTLARGGYYAPPFAQSYPGTTTTEDKFAKKDYNQAVLTPQRDDAPEMLHNIPPFAKGSAGEQYWLKKIANKADGSWPSEATELQSGRDKDYAGEPSWHNKPIGISGTSNGIKKPTLSELLSIGQEEELVKEEDLNLLPTVDDFNSPIRWVKFNSNDTEDGLARVTDTHTGRNRQAKIHGVVYVPVADYSLQKPSLRSIKPTDGPQIPHDEKSLFVTLTKNVNMDKIEDRDWLAIEVAMGMMKSSSLCDGDGCPSRCHKLGCETSCSGDTCAAGCVSDSCTAFCKGPGCMAMCIGVQCNAICDGMSCESRCFGKGCESQCRKFTCHQMENGVNTITAGGTWDEHYPQYSDDFTYS